MSKKGSSQKQLSPENYIRTKARNLPVYECIINPDWKEAGIANILIARKHNNGNITACNYLVDTMALGVKDGNYFFSLSLDEYEEIVSEYKEELGFQTIDYALAHNIILAADEYADDLGISSCKIYRDTIQYMLSEDSDDIELIDIECGRNGKPFLYLTEDMDSVTKANYHSKLKKAVGEQGYDFMEGSNNVEELDDNELRFCELFDRMKSLKEKEIDELNKLSDTLMDKYVSKDEVEVYYEKLKFICGLKIYKTKYSPEFFGLNPGDDLPSKKAISTYCDLLTNSFRDQDSLPQLKNLESILPNHPATALAEVLVYRILDVDKFREKIGIAVEKYPDFGMLKMIDDVFVAENFDELLTNSDFDFYKYFGNRSQFNQLEIYYYFICLMTFAAVKDQMECLAALTLVADELNMDEGLKQQCINNSYFMLMLILRNILD